MRISALLILLTFFLASCRDVTPDLPIQSTDELRYYDFKCNGTVFERSLYDNDTTWKEAFVKFLNSEGYKVLEIQSYYDKDEITTSGIVNECLDRTGYYIDLRVEDDATRDAIIDQYPGFVKI